MSVRVGLASAAGAVTLFSLNDVMIKLLSGLYAMHQIIAIRSVIGLMLLLAIAVPLAGGWAVLKTAHPRLHLIRGGAIVVANTCFFLALAAMPLAEAVAIFFISPVLITLFSTVFLGERAGPWRWGAVLFGFLGVLVVMRPGTEAFDPAALLPLGAAAGYATLHVLTRRLGRSDGAVTMAVYIQLTFLTVSAIMGALFGSGWAGAQSDPSLAFLLRAWTWPAPGDWAFLAALGGATALAGILISQAYRICAAAVVAPVEYLALPLSVLFGWLVFDEWPDGVALAGIAAILAAGLVLVWREARGTRLRR
ncbi:DMT family transporter [Rhodobacteraceae bacterium CCMM004]|nr:DMT family transporter [Rhodobacteraceae bacterium CCMM004]